MVKKFYFLLILWFLSVQLMGATAPETQPPVSIKRLYADVNALTTIEPPRNYKNLSSLDQAADYIFKEFSKCTTRVEIQDYRVEGNEYKNVIASFGAEEGKRIVVGAHYDVCGDQPGADDNGSGVAAVLELARLFSILKPGLGRRIDLVAYTLEEPPYFRSPHMGSAIHANRLAAAKVKIHVMISVDMIGYFSTTAKPHRYISSFIKPGPLAPGNCTSLVGKKGEEKITQTIEKYMREHSGIAVTALNLPADTPGMDFSDHLNFWKHNYPAVMLSNFFICPNYNYHKPTDTIEKLDFNKIAGIVKGLFYALINL